MPAFVDRLRTLIADPAIELLPAATGNGRPAAPPSRLDTEAFKVIEAVHQRVHGVPTLPTMLAGATDMAQVRARGVQCYGIGPAVDREDTALGFGAHSDQERILEDAFQTFVRVHFEIVRGLAAAPR
jgi:acetylornithine deacetylase/succinyl-diaminopimelate desuccinylase-like protein